jgi:putative two-component system response regulator
VYDALVSVRVYKRAYTKQEAFSMIMNGECGVFSPKILKSFLAVRSQFEHLAETK